METNSCQVQIIDVDAAGNYTARGECDLLDCFPDRDESYRTALDDLAAHGCHWSGGGASPLVLLLLLRGAPHASE